jgi:hypothetical protein
MRLIDADDLIEAMKKTEEEYEDAMTCPSWWSAYNVIKEQPTAYEAEKVVADLQTLKTKYKQLQRVTEDKFVVHELEMRCLQIDKDIEIVKAGGVT